MPTAVPLLPVAGAQPAAPHPDAPAVGARLRPHFEGCYGCGTTEPHGLHLEVERDAEVSVRARFTVTEHHQGAPGLAHGGVLAAALDDTIGYVLAVLRRLAVTGGLQVDYRRPVPVGTTLHLSARCTGVLGRKIWAEGEGRLGAPDGPVAVQSRALFVEVDAEHFLRNGSGVPSAETYNP